VPLCPRGRMQQCPARGGRVRLSVANTWRREWLYRKLGASTCSQADTQARELGLLED